MVPNFQNRERILTDKLSYQFGEPKRGDVVVFKAPASEPCSENECEYIKRIIGIPGDRVMVSGGQVYLNGELLKQDFLPADFVTEPGAFSQEGVEVEVPEDSYLVFGDNRSHSRDGREFGPISRKLILGKAFFRYWPLDVIGLLPSISL